MRVEISVEPGPPPAGTVTVDGGAGRRFEGWLGLLHILSRALEPGPQPESSHGLGEARPPASS